MRRKMETTIVYWGYVGEKLENTWKYCGYIREEQMQSRLHARETPGGFEVAGCVYFHGFGAI